MLLKLNNSHIRTLIRCFQTRTRSEKLLLFSTVGAGGWNNLNFNSLADKVPYLNNNIFQQKRWVMHDVLTKRTVEDRIMLVLNLYDKIDNDKLTMDSDFFKDLGLDSLDFVEVILAIEDEFSFEIPDGDSDRMKTPRDIYQYICDKADVIE
ncbi:Acyl carrier protein [Meloidogyne graminicola]|uniref:Acyl carrier protein n=1 Tax=Meloidogyne graminicola TaxID=189291 RepID=A0A8S9ZKJ9_9BILA|nr:Acyl carrier protein [Meloidogyne graminicola]